MGKWMVQRKVEIMSFDIELLVLTFISALTALMVQRSAEWTLAFSGMCVERWREKFRTNEALIKPLCRLKHPLNSERRAQAEFDWGWNYLG